MRRTTCPPSNPLGKKEDDRSLLLFAAYVGGNTRSQLLSGVKQNDRYSGLVTLFAVYRRLQAKDKEYRIAEVDHLRKLHEGGKLLAHLVELERKMPTKLSPEAEKARARNKTGYSLAPYGINLPSALALTRSDVAHVCANLRAAVRDLGHLARTREQGGA